MGRMPCVESCYVATQVFYSIPCLTSLTKDTQFMNNKWHDIYVSVARSKWNIAGRRINKLAFYVGDRRTRLSWLHGLHAPLPTLFHGLSTPYLRVSGKVVKRPQLIISGRQTESPVSSNRYTNSSQRREKLWLHLFLLKIIIQWNLWTYKNVFFMKLIFIFLLFKKKPFKIIRKMTLWGNHCTDLDICCFDENNLDPRDRQKI